MERIRNREQETQREMQLNEKCVFNEGVEIEVREVVWRSEEEGL